MNKDTLQQATEILIKNGFNEQSFLEEELRANSLLYMIYWIDRLKNNQEEQKAVKNNLNQYIDRSVVKAIARSMNQRVGYTNQKVTVENLMASPDYEDLVKLSHDYVEKEIVPVQTVDLVIERTINNDEHKKEVLLFERNKFPKGLALPGGIVEDSDETNELNIDQKTFAALRVAAEKVLYLEKKDRVYKKHTEQQEVYYSVEDPLGTKKIIIRPQQVYGYHVRENIRSVIRPSDPRHLVDTIGFKCEIIDNDNKEKEYFWESKQNLLDHNITYPTKNFAFNHHKEIILHTLGKTSLETEMKFNETHFIKDIIENPIGNYNNLKKRFEDNKNRTNSSFPELFPTVNTLLHELFSEEINNLCKENEMLIGFRDKVTNSLRHVSLKNRTFCPYLPTVNAIFDAISFFDVVARYKKDFYQDISTDTIIEHDPKSKKNAAYHMYKYEYRMDELLGKVPDEIIIPTFANLSATDLMKVRGVPIRFVGLSKDFIYVDEFEQSPEEFLMHDINHSYRMSEEDEKYLAKNNMTQEQLVVEQNKFIKSYINSIRISKDDDEKTKEIKKIKKIILFEVCHEDAKPLLPDVVLSALIRKEGGETKFELPVTDEATHYMDIVDVLDTEISTLSYVRNKLQCGFYDKVDNQNGHIVNPKYRKSRFIAEAALDMVGELSNMLNQKVDVDYEYLLKRVCSVGPNNIYEPVEADEMLEVYGDGADYLNPKRYQSNQKKM